MNSICIPYKTIVRSPGDVNSDAGSKTQSCRLFAVAGVTRLPVAAQNATHAFRTTSLYTAETKIPDPLEEARKGLQLLGDECRPSFPSPSNITASDNLPSVRKCN